jgi:hypothetical protein
MRNLITKLALACLLFSPLPAFAQERCIPIEAGVEMLEKVNAKHRVLDPDEKQRAVELYNNTPPVGEFTFEFAIMIDAPNGAMLLWFGNEAAFCASMGFPPDAVQQVKLMIEGPRA